MIAVAIFSVTVGPLQRINQALADSLIQTQRELAPRREEELTRAERRRASEIGSERGASKFYGIGLLTNEIKTFGICSELYGLPANGFPHAFEEWLLMAHPDDRDRVETVVVEAIRQQCDFDVEFRSCWPDGSVGWMCGKGAVYCDESGPAVRTAGINFDVTERRRSESSLREILAAPCAPDSRILRGHRSRTFANHFSLRSQSEMLSFKAEPNGISKAGAFFEHRIARFAAVVFRSNT
jgi:hypothetical protein